MSATTENAAPAAKITYLPPDESTERTIDLVTLPFVIGRADTADLHLPSNRVSREHAILNWEEDQFWVRDLGSTNGTFVNGERIEREAVGQGDSLRVADIEISLVWDDEIALEHGDVVTTVRSWQEMLLRRGAPCGFEPVWDLQQSSIGGGLVVGLDRHLSPMSQWPATGLRCSQVSRRLNWLMLVRAVELAGDLPSEFPLLLSLEEETDAEKWMAMLARSAQGRELVVRLPFATSGHERLISLCRNYGFRMAMRLQPGDVLPEAIEVDQWWLSKEFTEGIAGDESRWQSLSDLIQAASDAGAEVMAMEIAEEDTTHVCAEMGCKWGSGPLFGGPRAACEIGAVDSI